MVREIISSFWPKAFCRRSASRIFVALATFCLFASLAQPTLAVDYTWGNVAGDFGDAARWTPGGGPPGAGDTAFLTNNVTAVRIATNSLDRFVTTMIISNTTGVVGRMIVMLNGTSMTNATTIIGSGGKLEIGRITTQSEMFSTNLFLVGSGQIAFVGAATAAGGPHSLTVFGTFTNTTQSIISNVTGAVRMRFLGSGAVTNNGLMSFVITPSSAGHTNLTLEVAGGVGSFINAGTFQTQLSGLVANRQAVFSNQFINAGTFIVTNDATAAGGSLSFHVTGISGTSLTNEATGTMRFVATGSGTGVRNVMTLNAGGFVNLGTLSFQQTGGTANNLNDLVLAQAGTVFSNAVGSQFIVEDGNIGNIRVLADRAVNLGTNIVRAGTLSFLSSTAGAGILENAGVIILNGGNLVAAANTTNKAGGLIRTTSGTGTLVNNVVNQAGGTIEALGGTLVFLVTPDQLGRINVGTLTAPGGTLQIGTAGAGVWTNSGTIFLADGHILSGNLTNTSAGLIRGSGTLSGLVVNRSGGIIDATNGILTLLVNPAMEGTVSTRNDGSLKFGSTGALVVTNAGIINMFGGTIIAGELTNNAAGVISTADGNTAVISNRVINLGTMNVTSAVMRVTGGVTNAATGTINLRSTGTLTGFGALTNVGTISTAVGGNIDADVFNASAGTINATNGVLRIAGDLATAGRVVIGAATSSGTVSNGNLFMVGSSVIIFTNASGSAVQTLLVAGTFTNTTTSTVRLGTAAGTSEGGSARILFTDPAQTVTNKGTFSFLMNGAGATFTVQVGTGAGTFRNEGTFVANLFAGSASRTGTMSNLFVNAGLFLMTNNVNTVGTRALTVQFTGNMTNEAAGTINLVTTNNTAGAHARNVISNTVGDVVNLGTITSLAASGAGNTLSNVIMLTGGTFSNAPGGQVITRAGNTGYLVIRADTLVNAGTNLLNGGTLLYQNAAGGAGFLRNPGTILFNGAHLDGSTVTNTATGNIINASGDSSIGGLVVNQGFVHATSGALTLNGGLENAAIISNTATLSVGVPWSNTGTLVNSGGTLTGSDLANSGTINLSGTSRLLNTRIDNSGTLNVSGIVSNTGVMRNLVGGLVSNVAGSVYHQVNAAGSTTTNLGTWVAGGLTNRFSTTGVAAGASNHFYNAGTFTFDSGLIGVGSFINAGTFNANNTAFGTITITGTGNVFSNDTTGVIIVRGGGTNQVAGGTAVNLGIIDTYGNGTFGVADGVSFTNASGGFIINTNSAATLAIRAQSGFFANAGTIMVRNGATIEFRNNATPFTGTGWTNEPSGTVVLGDAATAGILNSGTIVNNGTISGTGTINLRIPGTVVAPRPYIQGATGSLIVTNGDLTITHLQTDRLFIGGGTLSVSAGNTLRIYTDFAATTNALLRNSGTISMRGGTIESANITNEVAGTIIGYGTLSFNGALLPSSSNLVNRGTIFANSTTPLVIDGSRFINEVGGVVTASSGRLIVNGVFTNAGTLSFMNSRGTFNSIVVNTGTIITDPTTLTFYNNFTNATGGVIQMDAGDVFVFGGSTDLGTVGSFVNISTNNVDNDLLPGKFLFNNTTLALTQNFYIAGHDFNAPSVVNATNQIFATSNIPGFTNNFALGTLEISNFSTVRVWDAFSALLNSPGTNDNLMAALYVGNLHMGANSLLIISSNVQVYFVSSNSWGLANIAFEGSPDLTTWTLSGIHQLVVIPEPSVLMLFMVGGIAMYIRRNRRRRARA